MAEEADAVESAVDRTLSDGCRTGDIAGEDTRALTCTEMTQAVLANL
jgi:3-isopropylmalate dehydrogenase